jgi:hypothetical protein
MTRRHSFLAGLSGLALAALLAPASLQATPTPCFDVGVQYLGRTYFGNIGGIDYYTWNYRVTGETCLNRGLSNWVLGICQNYWNLVTNVSTTSNDVSDLAGGTTTGYVYSIGTDPNSGVSGLKWDFTSGNQLNKPAEYDDFSFVAPGGQSLVTVTYGAKGSTIVETGTTIGPSCTPVPVETTSWSQVKARFGN